MTITRSTISGSFEGFSTGFDADGDWQAVTIPTGKNCKSVRINCRPDDTAVYTHVDNPTEFHVSFNYDGTFFDWCTGVSFKISKTQSETVCYVRATAGYKFVVTGLQ